MPYGIETIEDAVIATLAPLKTSVGVRTIKSYQGELDSEEDLVKAARLFPAVIVMYGGSVYEEHGARKIETMTYVAFVCDRSLRTEEEARRGGTRNPGTYAMLSGMRNLLYGSRLGIEIFPMELRRENAVWFGKGISVYSAEYETSQALLYVGD